MKISKNFIKIVSGSVLLMWGYDMVISAVADSNRQSGYVDGFSEGCKYARRRGINENKDNNGSENKD